MPIPSDEEVLLSNTLEDLISAAAANAETEKPPHPATDQSETPMELQEHQYCSSAPDSTAVQTVKEHTRRKTVIEPTFTTYNHVARYVFDDTKTSHPCDACSFKLACFLLHTLDIWATGFYQRKARKIEVP